ncbi:NfeD family protein [Lacipirellula sp.]|uniref:NfeD family protein n=1 Tax=Lacipirellula sp. TaxID=2691419 RepID=UPI003D0AC1AE
MNLLDPIGWAVVLLVVGCGLLALETFIPSGGILSFLAFVAVVASTVVAFNRSLTTGLSFMAVAVLAIPLAIGLAFKVWPKTPMGRAILGDLPSEEDTKPDDSRRALVGRVGVAQSLMLPSGAVLVDGRLIDAVSQGIAIEPGQPVVIVEVRANRVMVRPAATEEAQAAAFEPDDVLARPIEEFGFDSLEDPLA